VYPDFVTNEDIYKLRVCRRYTHCRTEVARYIFCGVSCQVAVLGAVSCVDSQSDMYDWC